MKMNFESMINFNSTMCILTGFGVGYFIGESPFVASCMFIGAIGFMSRQINTAYSIVHYAIKMTKRDSIANKIIGDK